VLTRVTPSSQDIFFQSNGEEGQFRVLLLLEFDVFYANCFKCRISFCYNALVLGRKTQSYCVRREREGKRKTMLCPNADAILKVRFFIH